MGKNKRGKSGESPGGGCWALFIFYSRSNSPVLINDLDEGSDSVPGDGERRERGESESGTWFIWSRARGKRERECWVGAQVGGRGGGGGIPVCSVQGRGADWRTLTSAQQEQLDSITQSSEGSQAAALHGRGPGGGGDGWPGGGGGRAAQPTNTVLSGSGAMVRGNWVCVAVLNEPLQRPRGGLKATWGKLLRPSPFL